MSGKVLLLCVSYIDRVAVWRPLRQMETVAEKTYQVLVARFYQRFLDVFTVFGISQS